MSTNTIFDKFNSMVDAQALAQGVKDVQANGGSGEYEKLPHGEYEVSIEKMEIKESKKGDPMFSCWFKVVQEQHKGSFIFMNQVILQAFQIHIVNELLRSLNSGLEIEFDGNYAHFNNLIMDVHEKINGKFEYLLDYGKTKKDFDTFKIKEVYTLEEETPW